MMFPVKLKVHVVLRCILFTQHLFDYINGSVTQVRGRSG